MKDDTLIEDYRIVTWPESQMYMEHPQAKLLNSEEDLNKYGVCAYRIPKDLMNE